jgi:hypothetical protein
MIWTILLVLRGILLLIAAVFLFRFWKRTQFWLPAYIHWLAIVSLLIMIWSLSTVPDDAPLSKDGLLTKLLLALSVPAVIYATFIVFGGQNVAFRRQFGTAIACPVCRKTISSFPAGRGKPEEAAKESEVRCPNCGHAIPNNLANGDPKLSNYQS